jgi:multiple sugar transport system substrate-binding protein
MNLPPIDLSRIPRKALFFGVVGLAALLFFLVVLLNLRGGTEGPGNVELAVWGTLPGEEFEALLTKYKELREETTVNYREIEEKRYGEVLLGALAAGEGPDVFMIPNRGLPKEQNKLVPAPPELISLLQFQELYPAVVEEDFVDAAGGIYALPLYVDTLALIYNDDLFARAAVTRPPATWTEFKNLVPSLRVLNEQGQIVRAAAAIGGSESTIRPAADILSLLMLQDGAPIVDRERRAAEFGAGEGRSGVNALNFYVQFANAGSPYYTWNDTQQEAFEAFAGGKVAMVFGYASDLEAVKMRAPFVRARVAPVPQPGEETVATYPSYAGLAVSKQSPHAAAAWDFVVQTLANAEVMAAYANASGRPPALRDLIASALTTPNLSVFARQALTARSWYNPNEAATSAAFSEAIRRVIRGQVSVEAALREMEEVINGLLRE